MKDRKKYEEYLRSNEWKELKLDLLMKRGCKCQKCGATKQPNHIQVHHLTYERLFNELETDLLLVCGKCHKEIHGIKDKKKKPKSAKLIACRERKKDKSKMAKFIFERNYKKIMNKYKSGKYTKLKADSMIQGIITWYNNRVFSDKKKLDNYKV